MRFTPATDLTGPSRRLGAGVVAMLAAAGLAVAPSPQPTGPASAQRSHPAPGHGAPTAPAAQLSDSEANQVSGGLAPRSGVGRQASTWAHVAVAAAPTADGKGFWVAWADGTVTTMGTATSFGDMAGKPLNAPMVGISATADGKGYWLLGRDGGVFTFGDATFAGSTGNIRLNAPALQMTTPGTRSGYYFVAGDGGVFSFGGAPFYGSTGNVRLNQPVVGMASNRTGSGYWLVASDGGIFSFGQAGFYGSTGNIRLNQPVIGLAPTPSGAGYWLLAADGGIFTFGNAGFHGSAVGSTNGGHVVSLVPTADGGGYWIVFSNGGVLNYGDAPAIAGAAPPAAATPVPSTSADYSFEVTASNGQPIRWNPCEALHYSVVTAGAPPSWASDVADAVGQLSHATGLRLVEDGTYAASGSVPSSSKLVISWVSALTGGDDVGLTTFQYYLDPAWTPQITSANVQILSSLSGGGGLSGEVPVLLHELGHAAGLGHYNGPVVMNPVDQGMSSYQGGDLAGLSRLGATAGCAGFYS